MTKTETSVAKSLQDARNRLATTSESARADSEILLAHVLQKSRTWLFAHSEALLSPETLAVFQHLVEARSRGFPVAYLTGTREFWSLPLRVDAATLIPRPETELLVETTLQRLCAVASARVLDLGTGSGAIALALASVRRDFILHAADISEAALACARINAHALGLTEIHFHHSNWFSDLPRLRFDAIVSNPPYLAADDPHLSEGDVRFEPLQALVSGTTGLEAFEAIANTAPLWLTPGGWLLLEHGCDQGALVRDILQQAGFSAIETLCDLEARDRVSVGRWQTENL
ncbi:protein methyltransferase HemK [Legionella geestiana]|uniref:Release factor glutamine methyltransferase n=1 Tax=Legionella geestiana TaxID=45065 RepID=A0A0W0TTX3_9GAMM|nr:peptide chain release factor N(5)-glutamine methyltransferase [Legionella geestiana]KTC98926.1 protein methyltransferase HemK [Legionella geestiana]QBS13017.1 peptide chain release factor N(5)-glutamine methyltransferase [Legionella geestiana]STX54473.1 HemK protein [Legionella geestiana]